MGTIDIKLLGGLEVRGGGQLLSFPTRHSALVLACLSLAPEMRLTRNRLIELLWADRADAQARASLRQTLYRLRAIVGDYDPPLLHSDRNHIWLDPALVHCDVIEFKKVLEGDPTAMQDAVAFGSGDILEGQGTGHEVFETWLAEERADLKARAVKGYYALAAQQYADGAVEYLEKTAQRLVSRDSFDEAAHRLLMAVSVLLNRRNNALKIYQQLSDRLKDELDVEPDQDTVGLYLKVRDSEGAETGGKDKEPFHSVIREILNVQDTQQPEIAATTSLSERLRGRPYLAVLPFDNLSNDTDQEYFSDAITEDLIAALSRVRAFYVIARNSTFTYRRRAVQVRQIREELGARYVIEGSVRRAGNRVRIIVQLIDAVNDRHIWADRYDREMVDVFDLQDEITQTIVGAIEPELASAEYERARRKPPDDLSAWDCYNRGNWHCNRFNAEDFTQGLRLFDQAIELDPMFARAYGAKAIALHGALVLGYCTNPKEIIPEAVAAGKRAVALDDKDPMNHHGLGRAYSLTDELEAAVTHFNDALRLNPSYAPAHFGLITVNIILGQAETAVEHADAALRLSPQDPLKGAYLQAKAHGLYHLRRYEDAVDAARLATQYPTAEFWAWAWLAASLAQLGRIDEAKQAMTTGYTKHKDSSLKNMRATFPIRPTYDIKHTLEGLKLAGLPR